MTTQAEMAKMRASGASQADMASHVKSSGGYNGTNSRSSSGDSRGNEGNNYTNYLTPAPKVTTPIYPSPNEQGQNNTITTTTKAPNTTTNNTTNNNYIENSYKDQWIRDWANEFSTASDENFAGLNTSFLNSNKQNADNIYSNYQLIGDNENSIAGNLKSTGLQIDGIENDYSNLFNDVGDVEDSIDSTNKDVDGLNANLSNLGGDLEGLAKVQKDYGLKLTDQNGNIVDLERDIVANERSQQQGQRADQTARNSQDAAINKALEQVDYQFGDITKAQAETEQNTAYSFSLADDAIETLVTDLGDLGLNMDNITFGLGEDVIENAEAIEDSNTSRGRADQSILDQMDRYNASQTRSLEDSNTNQGRVDQSILDQMDRYNASQTRSLEDSNTNQGRVDQSILDQMDRYNAAQTRSLEDSNTNQGRVDQSILDQMDRYNASQTRSLEDSNTNQGKVDQSILDQMDRYNASQTRSLEDSNTNQGKVDQSILDQMDRYNASQTRSLEDSNTNQGKVDQSILDQMDRYNASQTRSLEDSNTNQGRVDQSILDQMDRYNAAQTRSLESSTNDSSTARDQLKKAIISSTDGKFTTINDYISAVERGEAETNENIIRLMEQYDAAQTRSLETSNTSQGRVDQSILDQMDRYNASQTRSLEDSNTSQGKVDQSILDQMDRYNASQTNALEESSTTTGQQIEDLKDDVVNQGTELSIASDKAIDTLEAAITKKYNGKITSVEEYVAAVQNKSIKVDREIEMLLSASNTALIASMNESRKKTDRNLDDAMTTVNSDMETYASAASTTRDKLKKAIISSTDGKFTTINDYISAVERGEAETNENIINLMEQYDAAQTRSLEASNTSQGRVDQSILNQMDRYNASQTRSLEDSNASQGRVDQSILNQMDRYNASQTRSLEDSNANQGRVDQSILNQMDRYNASQTRSLEDSNTNQGKVDDAQDNTIEQAGEFSQDERNALDSAINKKFNGQITSVQEYMKAVENGIIERDDEIEAMIKASQSASDEANQNQNTVWGGLFSDEAKRLNTANADLAVQLEESSLESKNANDAQDDAFNEKDKYDQEYWSNRLKELKANGLSESDVQRQLQKEMSILKDKTYSGDTIVTEEDHITAWADFNGFMYSLGITDAGPNAPKEYMYETFLSNIDQWVKDGKVSVESSTSGMFDENITNIYTLPDGKQVITKGTSPMFTDENGEEFRFGNDTITLYMDGVDLGSRDGDITTVTKQGEANHVDSTVNIGDDTNPNSEGNRTDGDNSSPTPEPEVVEEPVEEASTDPVVGEDIPLPSDLTDPEGDGAYGQDGRAFTLDGVTYWKRIKDRNGRWTYSRLDSYQSNGTGSRRSSWGANVQNF